jgi:hypothetical protein
MVEFCDATAASAGSSCRELRALLESLGYELYRYRVEDAELEPEPMGQAYCFSNLIATKHPAGVRERLRGATPVQSSPADKAPVVG